MAFHDASGRPLERHVLLERQYGTHGFDCKAVNGTYGADLRQRYRDGLMSEDEKSALQEMNFNFTYYGTYPFITKSAHFLNQILLARLSQKTNWRKLSSGEHTLRKSARIWD